MSPPVFTHQQRIGAARSIFERLRERYANDLLAVAIEGSVAKRIDAPYSDLELRVILRTDVDRWYPFFYQGLFCGISYVSLARVEADAREVDYEWPVTFDRLITRRVLFDPEGVFARLTEMARDAELSAPWNELVREAVADVYEHVYKVFNALEAPQHVYDLGAVAEARACAYWSAVAVGLHNRHRYRSAIRMYDEAINLPLVPDGYRELLPPLLSTQTTVESLGPAAWSLWLSMRRWAEQIGIRFDDDELSRL